MQAQKISIKKLDVKRFNVLVGQSRSPAAAYVSKELEWYANEDETVIGVLLLDTVDDDFLAIVMARDENDRFCAFDIEVAFSAKQDARNWLINALKWHTGTGLKTYPQGHKPRGPDLFTLRLPPEELHPTFLLLARDPTFYPARSVIKEMMPHFVDVDGNFVEQFQSRGFDARLWELYLYAYLSEEELFLDRSFASPDFLAKKYGKSVAIEAVVTGRKDDNPPLYLKPFSRGKTAEDVLEAQKNYIPITFGSPLYSKLKKTYWEFPHVKSKPLILAIADFHDDGSMLWTSTALSNYLYGTRYEWHHDDQGKLILTPYKIDNHQLGKKQIPSGFFFQPAAEYISAVLFSASGTISKFNRMGRQAGFYNPEITMIRIGQCYNHEPHAVSPKVFRYVVDETCEETWAEGLSMFHNPRAVYPVPEDLFPSIAHHSFRDKLIVSLTPDFHPFSSVTLNVTKYGQNPQNDFASRVKRHESELAFTDGGILIGGY